MQHGGGKKGDANAKILNQLKSCSTTKKNLFNLQQITSLQTLLLLWHQLNCKLDKRSCGSNNNLNYCTLIAISAIINCECEYILMYGGVCELHLMDRQAGNNCDNWQQSRSPPNGIFFVNANNNIFALNIHRVVKIEPYYSVTQSIHIHNIVGDASRLIPIFYVFRC